MKKIIDGILVVEGKDDKALLSSFIDCEIVVTNGYELSKETIDYLINASNNKRIIVLTDPDEAGETIRKNIHKYIPNCIDVVVDIKKCNKNGKHGVAECEISEIEEKISNFYGQKTLKVGDLTMSDLLSLNLIGENSKTNRDKICHEYKLGICNGKALLNRLNNLNISYDQLSKSLEE